MGHGYGWVRLLALTHRPSRIVAPSKGSSRKVHPMVWFLGSTKVPNVSGVKATLSKTVWSAADSIV